MEWEWQGKSFLSAFIVRALAKGNEILWLAGTAFGSRDVVKQASS